MLHRTPRSRVRAHRSALLCGALAFALAACTAGPRPPAGAPATPTAAADLTGYCAEAQAAISGVRVPAVNVVHSDYDAFVKSKPAVRPLETQQFLWYTDESRTRLRMISCKMKTADHVRTEYGADQAGEEGACTRLHERTLAAVRAAFTSAERRRLRFDQGRAVVLDPDEVATMGVEWLKPHLLAYAGADGALHLRAKGMRNDWLDPRSASRPVQFRGTRYCHVIAPSYLRALLLGEAPPEVTPPPAPPQAPEIERASPPAQPSAGTTSRPIIAIEASTSR
jgi:hypothetical protein